MAKTVQSRKAKGRRLQQWLVEQLISRLDVHPEDLESRSMGACGEDIIMSRSAREKFPFSVEAKNQESLNIWSALKQAEENSKGYSPLVLFKRNRSDVYVALKFEDFIELLKKKEPERP